MRKSITGIMIAISLIALPGCGGGEEAATSTNDQFTTYETDVYSILVPRDWEIVEKKNFTAQVPQNAEVVFRNNVKNQVFTPNISIVVKPIPEGKNTKDYATEVIKENEINVFNFNETNRESITLINGENETETIFISFEGKSKEENDILLYQQSYLAKGTKLYIVTGSSLTNADSTVMDEIKTSLKNFSLK